MLPSMSSVFSPSEAAEQSGFSLDTLRYYERIGLLDDIDRAPSGHRRFRDDDLEWLGVLRCLRETGMPIAQMRRYAELTRRGKATMAERLSLLTEHDRQVQERIALLQASTTTSGRRSTGTAARYPSHVQRDRTEAAR